MKCNYIVAGTLAAFLALFVTGYVLSEGHGPPIRTTIDSGHKNKQAEKSSGNNINILFYTVQPGDSLYRIAQTYNTTIAALKKANNLKGTLIHSGEQLCVPILPGSGIGAAFAFLNQALDAGSDLDNHPLRLRLARTGIGLLGISYRRGGSGENGFDCSGLVKNLFSRFDIELPRSSRQQYGQGEKIDRNELEIGDLVFFSPGGKQPNHVGIYIGENKFLHAAIKARSVIISDLNKPWYAARFLGARRIKDLWKDDAEAALQGKTPISTPAINEIKSSMLSHTLIFAPELLPGTNGIELPFDRLVRIN